MEAQVKGTITSHHLLTTFEDAEKDAFSFCKPIPKVRRPCSTTGIPLSFGVLSATAYDEIDCIVLT